MTHTPGPWRWQKGERYWRLYAGDDTQPGQTVSILRADCRVGDHVVSPKTVDTRLIAAAPEMVETIAALVAVYQRVGGPLSVDLAVTRARALLAKIEGKE